MSTKLFRSDKLTAKKSSIYTGVYDLKDQKGDVATVNFKTSGFSNEVVLSEAEMKRLLKLFANAPAMYNLLVEFYCAQVATKDRNKRLFEVATKVKDLMDQIKKGTNLKSKV